MGSLLLFELVCFFFHKYYSEYLSKVDIDKPNKSITSLGPFFYQFLKFYGSTLDHILYQICLDKGRSLKEKIWNSIKDLCAININNENNN